MRCALRLALRWSLFVRESCATAEWKDIDLDAAGMALSVTKTDSRTSSRSAGRPWRSFASCTRSPGDGRYVFPGARTNKRPMSDNAILAAMRRMGIGKEEMTGHGFRAVARTILDEVLGVRPDFIEHQLAHAVRDPNGRAYNRTAHLPERRKMMQQWADYLDGLKAC